MDPETTEAEGTEAAEEGAPEEGAPGATDQSDPGEALEAITEELADELVGQVISNPEFSDILTPMVLVTLCGIAIACIALTTAAKQALLILKEGGVKVLDNAWFQAVLQLAQPAMGGALALAPGLLPFDRPLNVILGVCAGFLSPLIYGTVLKRFFPGVVVAGDSAKRAAIRMNGSGATKGDGGNVSLRGGTSAEADAEPTEPPATTPAEE